MRFVCSRTTTEYFCSSTRLHRGHQYSTAFHWSLGMDGTLPASHSDRLVAAFGLRVLVHASDLSIHKGFEPAYRKGLRPRSDMGSSLGASCRSPPPATAAAGRQLLARQTARAWLLRKRHITPCLLQQTRQLSCWSCTLILIYNKRAWNSLSAACCRRVRTRRCFPSRTPPPLRPPLRPQTTAAATERQALRRGPAV